MGAAVGVGVGTRPPGVGAIEGEGVGEGVADGDADGAGDGEALASGLGDVLGSTTGGVAPGPGWGAWPLWPNGSQLKPEPAKGSQVGEEPLNQTRLPGPRPSTKTVMARAMRSARTDDATFRRNAGRAVHAVPYDALTGASPLLFISRLLPPDGFQNEEGLNFLQLKGFTLLRPMAVIDGAHVIVFSTDPEADRAFFRDVLHLDSVDSGGGWLLFALPPAEVAVHPAAENGRHELYLMCQNVEATLDELRAAGVEIRGPIQEERWGRIVTIAPPGGGDLSIYEPRHPRATG